jgi:hypothetical protein
MNTQIMLHVTLLLPLDLNYVRVFSNNANCRISPLLESAVPVRSAGLRVKIALIEGRKLLDGNGS